MVSTYKFRWWVDQVCVPRNRIFFEYANSTTETQTTPAVAPTGSQTSPPTSLAPTVQE